MRSHEKLRTLNLHYHNGHVHQICQDGDITPRILPIKLNDTLITWSCEVTCHIKHTRDESHIDFRTQCVITTLAGGEGTIANDVLKFRKLSKWKVHVL